jgi:acyl-CoA thioester hydrolase
MSSTAEPYELPIDVQPEDIDDLGHVNNVTYLRWVQEAATAHWRAVAAPADQEQLYWVVVRHEIDYLHPAMPGDRIVARTWVGAATRIKFDRHTELLRERDRKPLARARTVWCPIDARTGKPTAVSAEVRAVFSIPS